MAHRAEPNGAANHSRASSTAKQSNSSSELRWRAKRSAASSLNSPPPGQQAAADAPPALNDQNVQAAALAQGTHRVSPVRWRSPVVQTQGIDPEPALLPAYDNSDDDQPGLAEDTSSRRAGNEPTSRRAAPMLARRRASASQQPAFSDVPDPSDYPADGLQPYAQPDEDAAEVLSLRCADEYAKLKQLKELSTNIAPSDGVLPPECPLVEQPGAPHGVVLTTFTWTASALCHKPLYLEDVALERYGHSWGPLLQPFVSGARFYLGTLAIPYKMGIEPPTECVYALGYYRPGSCAPYTLGPIPISARGALLQGVYATGAALSIP
jgi:hypothetical protein